MITKAGIHLLNAKQLTNLVRSIERNLPGFYYSVSQQKNELIVSVGATPDCLLDVDRSWAMTRDGDKGLRVVISTKDGVGTISTSQIVADIVREVEVERSKILGEGFELIPYSGKYRKHSATDLEKFKKRYNLFLKEDLSRMEDNFTLSEVYVGSCTLSVDASLRGTNYNEEPIDCSFDLNGDAILGDSLAMAIDWIFDDFASKGIRQ